MAYAQELFGGDIVRRHDELMRHLRDSIANMCIALFHIREEQTYRVQGFKHYGDFLKREGIGKANGRLYANAGPIFIELRGTNDEALVRHVDMLKPIHKMGNAKQQATIVRVAANRARKEMVPFTAQTISDIAEKNYGWLPETKYRDKDKKPDGVDHFAEIRKDYEAAFKLIGEAGFTGYEAVQMFGNPFEWDGYEAARTFMRDAEDSIE